MKMEPMTTDLAALQIFSLSFHEILLQPCTFLHYSLNIDMIRLDFIIIIWEF